MKKLQIGSVKKMNNVKIVFDCEKQSTSFVPLSAVEIQMISETGHALLTPPVIEEVPTE